MLVSGVVILHYILFMVVMTKNMVVIIHKKNYGK